MEQDLENKESRILRRKRDMAYLLEILHEEDNLKIKRGETLTDHYLGQETDPPSDLEIQLKLSSIKSNLDELSDYEIARQVRELLRNY